MPRSGPGPATGAFHILTLPALGASNPPISRNKVDLPQPEAPIRQMNSPSSIVSEAPAERADLARARLEGLGYAGNFEDGEPVRHVADSNATVAAPTTARTGRTG